MRVHIDYVVILTLLAVPLFAGSGLPSRKTPLSMPQGGKVIRPSGALELQKRTTLENAAEADRIVLARALGSRVAKGPGGNIFTHIDFSVSEMVKGKIAANKFTLRLFGGRLDGVEIDSPLDGEFVPGSEYVLFLGKNNTEGYPTLNPQSIFSVREDPQQKTKVASPGPSGLTLYRAGTKKKASYTQDAVYLADLLYSLKIAGGAR